jgi:hypothetical protein
VGYFIHTLQSATPAAFRHQTSQISQKFSGFQFEILTLQPMERVCTIFLWLVFFFVPTINGYSSGLVEFSHVTRSDSDGFSVFEENGKVGLKDEKGQILIPASYDAIGWSNGKLSTIDRVVGYQSKGLWGLITISNKVITPAEFLELTPAEGSFLTARKKSPLSQRASFGCINTSGKTIIPFSYDAIRISNMRAVVMSRSQNRFRYGLIDLTNKILIPLQYQRIYSIGSLRYAVENFENKTALFSEEGKQVSNFLIDSISAFKKDYAIVYQNQRQGLMNRNGEMQLPPSYRQILLTEDGTIQVRQMDSWYILDGENNLIRQMNADSIKPLSPDHYAIKISDKFQLTDNNFQTLNEAYFSSFTPFRSGKSIYKNAGKCGLISDRGKLLMPPAYNELTMDGGFILACIDVGHKNRWALLDSAGNTLTNKQYDHISPFNGKFFPVRSHGFWGAIDPLGKEIVACVHDSLVQESGNHIVVKFKGKFGVINLNENWVVTPQPNRLMLLDDDKYFAYAGNTTFLKSFSGNIIYFSDNRLEFKTNHLLEHLASGAFWIIDMSGIIIDRSYQPDNADRIFHESEGLRAIRKDGKYGFIDARGRLRIANRYEDVKKFSNGLAAIKIRDKWGFIDEDEKLVAQPVYDKVENFTNGVAIVTQNNFSGLLDQNGKIILPLRYDEIVVDKQNRFLLKQNGLYGLADAKGGIIINPKYDAIVDSDNGYVIVQRNGKYGLLTLTGLSTIPMIYDGLSFDDQHDQYIATTKASWTSVKF